MSRGIMFHHFSNDIHPRGQGAISRDELAAMIRFLGPSNLLSPFDFYERAASNSLKDTDLCLTFDDALLCQYEVAAPVLADFGLSAFWFVYSSVFQGGLENLEIYRYFRTVAFEDIDDFYAQFFAISGRPPSSFDPSAYLPDDPFYTTNDRIFRFMRDDVLGPSKYFALMDRMLDERGFSKADLRDKLWMTNEHLKALHNTGHVVGLHSNTHPTRLAEMPVTEQAKEYKENVRHLTDILDVTPWAMSHPCNSYSQDTLSLLKDLGIKLGFRAYPAPQFEGAMLEIPREDHALVMTRMRS
jgi:peptidoglycan/xylan/chitin deacetylase (PgdA/CDA1 family)